MDQPKGQPAPMGTSYKTPGWHPCQTGIDGKEKLGAPDWPPTPVKMDDGQLQTKKGSTSVTATVANQWIAATVGQHTPVWMMRSDRKL